jgi:DNA-binding beta-propeller fold protein YncE
LKLSAEPAGSRHRLAYLGMAVAIAALSLLMIAGRAHADQIYWANEGSIAFSRLDASSGGEVPGSGGAVAEPEGMAIDTANGRLYVADESNNRIDWFNLDGSGHGVLNVPGAPINSPTGISIDPGTQTIYWANDVEGGGISWAFLNESGGGSVNTGSAAVKTPGRTVVDTADNKVFWSNEGAESLGERFAFAFLSNTGGGNLGVTGVSLPEEFGVTGMVVDPFEGTLYWLVDDEEETALYEVDVNGGKGKEFAKAVEASNGPTGLALDLDSGRFYWGNFGAEGDAEKAIGTATISNHGTQRLASGAPVLHPQYPVLLKVPEGSGTPEVTATGSLLSCTTGEWSEDQPGSFVYAAPTSLSYQWRKGATDIPGATGSTFAVTDTGTYSCRVTATNAAGSDAQGSNAVQVVIVKPKPVTPPPPPAPAAVSAKLASSKPVKVKAGGTATVAVKLANAGGLASGSVKVCGKLNKKAKKGLKAPKCVTVKSVAAGKTVVAKLKVKTLGSALGTYKFTVQVSGAMKKSLTAKVQVTAAKK